MLTSLLFVAAVASPGSASPDCTLREGTAAHRHLRDGRALLAAGKATQAVAELEAANDLGGGSCYEPLLSLAEARFALAEHEAAARAAGQAAEVADDRGSGAAAAALQGEILLAEFEAAQSGEADPALLAEAAGALRRALLFESSVPEDTRYLLARSLDLRGEVAEARDEYAAYVRRHPHGDYARRAAKRLRRLPDETRGDEPVLATDRGPVTAPVPVYRPQPPYPKSLRRAQVEGVVVLRAIIDAKGRVTEIEVLRGLHPKLDASAVKTVSGWKFEPARLTESGRPVAVPYTVSIVFSSQQ